MLTVQRFVIAIVTVMIPSLRVWYHNIDCSNSMETKHKVSLMRSVPTFFRMALWSKRTAEMGGYGGPEGRDSPNVLRDNPNVLRDNPNVLRNNPNVLRDNPDVLHEGL